MRGKSPDQFTLSRLKGGEGVCGGRGQFGNQPIWELNTISKLGVKLERCGVFDLMNLRCSRKVESLNQHRKAVD
jgi:hypothetical protein